MLYVFVTDNEVGENKIIIKMKKTADLFVNRYKSEIRHFYGEISIFNDFKNILLNNQLVKINCNKNSKCEGCPNKSNNLSILESYKKEQKGFFERLKTHIVN